MNACSRYSIGLGAICITGSAVFVTLAGPLDPPAGPVAPTYKTLAQVEPRIDIAAVAPSANARHLITQPGSYYLSANITGAASLNGIVIQADNVTLDLNGFALVGAAFSGDGILLGGVRANVTIKNGTIRGWAGEGIDASDDTSVNVSGVHAWDNGADGISVGPGGIVTACTAALNNGDGFQMGEGSTIQQCTATDNDAAGINAPGTGTGGQPGTGGAAISGCACHRNGTNGIQASNSAIHSVSVNYNGTNGLLMSNGTILDSEARGNGTNGFAGSGIVVSRCKARTNGEDGFNVGEGTILESCSSRANNGDGIEADREVTVRNCHVEDNNIDGTGTDAGIKLIATDCRIEGNTLVNNFNLGLLVPTGVTGNLIISNRASGHTTNYSIVAGNMVGTVVSSEAAMNAAANSLVNVAY